MIEIREVKTPKEQRAFVNFPLMLYKDNPYFVPPLYADEMKLFKSNYHYYETSEAVYFLAYRKGEVVGRISGILQKAANEKWQQKRVRFTRFDSIDDEEVAGDVAEAGFIPENRQRLECEPIQNLFCEERELVPRTLEDFSVCVHDFRGVLLAIHFGYLQFNLNEWNSEHLSESVGFLMLVSLSPQNAQNLLT